MIVHKLKKSPSGGEIFELWRMFRLMHKARVISSVDFVSMSTEMTTTWQADRAHEEEPQHEQNNKQ